MNNNFDFVQNATLNNSKSKEAHLFSQSKRFNYPNKPNCRADSYDLSKTMFGSQISLKYSILPREERFRTRTSVSPSPNTYRHCSFTDLNRSVCRGNTFAQDAKMKANNIKIKFPGPGSYQAINPEKKLQYTMRSRVKVKDYSSRVGPGQYQVDSYQTITKDKPVVSKYVNPKQAVIGTDKRFKDKTHLTPGPGPFAHSKVSDELGKTPKFSFGLTKKDASYIRKIPNPGPGSYNQFSQFSALKGGIASKSSHVLLYQ